MIVIAICNHPWGRVYFGYGNGGRLYSWIVDSAGQDSPRRCTPGMMNYHFKSKYHQW